MDSDDESLKNPKETPEISLVTQEISVKKKRGAKPKLPVEDAIQVLTKKPTKTPCSEERLKQLADMRVKGLARLTEIRRENAQTRELAKAELVEAKKTVELKKLDAAPKVKEIDSSMAEMRKEMAELKKMLDAERLKPKAPESELAEKPKKKVKKIIYEEESEGEEEVVKVVRKKAEPKPPVITGTALLDKLFFP